MNDKKFLAISKRKELLEENDEIYTTEAVIIREVKAATPLLYVVIQMLQKQISVR